MTNSPSIVPPSELIHQWHQEACKDPYHGGAFFQSKTLKHIATRAAQWGADQELEACCEWMAHVPDFYTGSEIDLRSARRPKTPSLKEQACDALDAYVYGNPDHGDKQNTYNIIRRALEALPND